MQRNVNIRRLTDILPFTLPLLAAYWLYGYSLTLPFFADDPNHYRFLLTVDSLSALWTGQTWSPYYRPVVYSIWEVMTTLQGGFDPVAQHAVNLAFFGLSGVLCALLLARLVPAEMPARRVVGALGGVAFVLVPFHYQAVNLVGSLTHLAVTFFVLLALVVGLKACRVGGWAGMLSVVAAFLANFSHETGFLVALFLPLVLLLNGAPPGRAARIGALPAAISVMYLLLWLTLPRVGTEEGLRLSSNIPQNLGVLAQAFVYPAAALLRPWVEGKGTPALMIGLFAGMVLAGGMITAAAGRRWLLAALAGLAWYLACVSPSVLLLQPDYVWSSPRLTVMASVGSTLFWACALLALWQYKGRLRRVARPAVVCSAALAWGVALAFLRGRQAEYGQMRDYTRELMSLAGEYAFDVNGALLINAPNYIETAPQARTFLVGAEFASFMTPEVDYRDYIALNTGRSAAAPIEAFGVGSILSYDAGVFVPYFPMLEGEPVYERLRTPRPVVVTQFEGDAFFPSLVRTPHTGLVAAEPLARFGDSAHLLGADAFIEQGRVRLRAVWQVVQPGSYKVFAHVVCNGQFIAQRDGFVWGNLYPFAVWQPGETQEDWRDIPLAVPADPACLRISLGLYDENTGTRLAAVDAQGRPLPENSVVVEVLMPQVDNVKSASWNLNAILVNY